LRAVLTNLVTGRNYRYMLSVSHILSQFDAKKLGEALGIDPGHARVLKVRKSVPPRYWPKLIEAAEAEGIEGVTYEALIEAHTPSRAEAAQ
jgi:hypothetical protein